MKWTNFLLFLSFVLFAQNTFSKEGLYTSWEAALAQPEKVRFLEIDSDSPENPFHADLSKLVNLELLDISAPTAKFSIPKSLSSLNKLASIYLEGMIEEIPSFIAKMENLEAFRVQSNVLIKNKADFNAFPATRRTTIFRRFWNSIVPQGPLSEPEIEKLYSIKKVLDWTSNGQQQKIGLNGTAVHTNKDLLILAVKGELLTKFPHTVVYANKATWKLDGQNGNAPMYDEARELDTTAGARKEPLFFAQAGNALLLGFELNQTEVKGQLNVPDTQKKPGWFFVFEEAYGDVHFGMDDNGGPAPVEPEDFELSFWDDLDWKHATSTTGFVKLNSDVEVVLGSFGPDLEVNKNINDAQIGFSDNSANLGYALYQKPVRLLVHGNELL